MANPGEVRPAPALPSPPEDGRDDENEMQALEDRIDSLPICQAAVERNLEIVSRRQWNETLIETGDRLEVVHFVGGGSGRRDAF